ncbi:bifunctional 4-hydroxy-2-oxoglutarate aldolase/2-dehydro-3-deoxy-phosphogluconate aldolase [Kribbella sandramycini]|uniref:bifunctional 4-hydroxy-2-oxoglutarate aldolase/2-dehydro-3-deoxy-phosphogluconate aldolase n=1 Tax=Kribbella sandramycini TaxID=60450 RepID=UPI0031D5E508
MDLLAELRTRKLLAIIRADSAATALACVDTLVEAGVTALEISLTTPDAVAAIAQARATHNPTILIGAGTVLTPAQADQVAAAGATFAVTPAITQGAHRAVHLGLPLLCGALTPTEVVAALDLGATAVKIFPAKTHGPAYLRELAAPLPQAPLIAVGGIDATTAPLYLEAGALAVGVGSPLLGPAAIGGPLPDLTTRATTFRQTLGL